MTTTQTGGGAGAAPAVGAGASERVVPTGPGWWLEGDPRDPSFVEVCVKDGALVGLFSNRDRVVADPNCRWLAPVPPPAECAAWAAAGRPGAAVLEALGEYGNAVMQRGPMQARGVNVSAALFALDAAIRADRDANGGAE